MLNAHDLELHRTALTGHCYRMLGSPAEAEDAVQETMIRAWKALDRFEERSSLRTWLTRIATRVCLDALSDRKKRWRPMELREAGTVDEPLVPLESATWVEPIGDEVALPGDVAPDEIAMLRESIRLAFVAALQHLPPRQRAALLLTEVLGWSAAEVADGLEMTVAAVNSALQRARATLAARDLTPRSEALAEAEAQLLEKYVEAFESYDVEALTSLLHQDAAFCMPPIALWLRGPEKVAQFLLGPGAKCRGSKLVPVAANGSPAFGQYHRTDDGRYVPWALLVLETTGREIATLNFFLDTPVIFPRFGLPMELQQP